MSFIEDSWIAHTKGKYPREFASPNRLHNPVNNNENFVKLIKAYAPAHDCFSSVYSFDDWKRNDNGVLHYNNAIIDTLFIDLDCDVLPYAHYEAKLLDLYFNHYKCIIRPCFSGNKGFAIYIDFPQVKLDKDLVKPILRKYLEFIQSVLSLKSIDRGCFDCISRISRLPNTINRKSGLYCIPLSREELWSPLSKILKTAKKPSKTPVLVNEFNGLPGILLSIEEDLKKQQLETTSDTQITIPEPFSSSKGNNKSSPTSLCPGIVDIINGASKGSRDNSLCALICALNLQTCKTKDEIFPIVKNWMQSCSPPLDMQDFQLSNKIDHLVSNQYRPCTFAMRTGNHICQRCPVSSR